MAFEGGSHVSQDDQGDFGHIDQLIGYNTPGWQERARKLFGPLMNVAKPPDVRTPPFVPPGTLPGGGHDLLMRTGAGNHPHDQLARTGEETTPVAFGGGLGAPRILDVLGRRVDEGAVSPRSPAPANSPPRYALERGLGEDAQRSPQLLGTGERTVGSGEILGKSARDFGVSGVPEVMPAVGKEPGPLGLPRPAPDPYSRLETIPAMRGRPSPLEAYQQEEQNWPTRDQFPVQKRPLWKNVLGAAATGLLGGAPAMLQFLGKPEAQAESAYQRALEAKKQRLGLITGEAKLGQEQAGQFEKTVEAGDQRFQFNPATNRYDIPVGQPKPSSDQMDLNHLYAQASQRAEEARAGGNEAGSQKWENVAQDYADRITAIQRESGKRTSPFEAFTYGTPEERRAAEEFLALEKKIGARYQKPGEIEQRYALFQRDPEAYKQMFGGHEAGASLRAHATKMLSYFQRQRESVQKDFMLDDTARAQRLREIGELERPFLDAAQAGGAGGPQTGDTVNVISPNGQVGTVPRKNLPKALKRGYKRLETE